jgi:hypothetical protein
MLHLLNKEESPAKDTSRISLKINLINAITALLIFIYFINTWLCDAIIIFLSIINALFFTAKSVAPFIDKISNEPLKNAIDIFINLFIKELKYAYYLMFAFSFILYFAVSISIIMDIPNLSLHLLIKWGIEIILLFHINLLFELIALFPFCPGLVYKFFVTRRPFGLKERVN